MSHILGFDWKDSDRIKPHFWRVNVASCFRSPWELLCSQSSVWYKTTSYLLYPPQQGLVLAKVHTCSLLLNTEKLEVYKEIVEHPTFPYFWDFVLLSSQYHDEHRTPWREEISVAINTLNPGNSLCHLKPSRCNSSSFAISHASAIRSWSASTAT